MPYTEHVRTSDMCALAIQICTYQFGAVKYWNQSFPENCMTWWESKNAWTSDCLGFVHIAVNGFKGDKSQLGGGAIMDSFVTNSDESTTFKFIGFNNRDALYDTIINLLNNTQHQTAAIANHNSDDTETLRKYKDLLDTGVISQEEFDAKKKQLLGL